MFTDEQADLWGKKLLEKCLNGNDQTKRYIRVLKRLVERINNDQDAIVFVGSEKGGGKSNFAIVSALIMRQLGAQFDFNTDIFYGEKQFRDAVEKISTKTRRVLIFDEMIHFGFSKNAMTRVNKHMGTLFTIARKKNHIVFMCMPYFVELDNTIRNSVNFWIQIFNFSKTQERDRQLSRCGLFRKDLNPFISDKWGFTDLNYKKIKVFNPQDMIRLMRRVRSYRGIIDSPRLPKVIEDEYKALSEEAVRDTGQKVVDEIVIQNRSAEKREAKENLAKEAVISEPA